MKRTDAEITRLAQDAEAADDNAPELAAALIAEQRERWRRIASHSAELEQSGPLHPARRRLLESTRRFLIGEYVQTFLEAEVAFGVAVVDDMRRIAEGLGARGHLPGAVYQLSLF